jgi:hypothetical protein
MVHSTKLFSAVISSNKGTEASKLMLPDCVVHLCCEDAAKLNDKNNTLKKSFIINFVLKLKIANDTD